ncbi:MAG: hypothetical protein FGM22_10745, partial [Burkholderiaceae bacterium]|nr:hypothetical protein [Burkholderiaceae bacterium]
MTPTLLDLALKAGFSDPIEGWMGEAYEERLEAFAKLIIEHEAAKQSAEEPVAWQVMVEDEAMKEFSIRDMAHDWCVQQKLRGSTYAYWIRPLYTRPQPAAQWVGLTDEERNNLWREVVGWGDPSHDDEDLMKAIEAKLKEKNG